MKPNKPMPPTVELGPQPGTLTTQVGGRNLVLTFSDAKLLAEVLREGGNHRFELTIGGQVYSGLEGTNVLDIESDETNDCRWIALKGMEWAFISGGPDIQRETVYGQWPEECIPELVSRLEELSS